MNKGICKGGKKELEKKKTSSSKKKKKKKKKKNTMKQGLRLVEAAASKLPTQSPITSSSSAATSSSSFFFFFFFSFFFLLMELCKFLFFAKLCISLSFFRLLLLFYSFWIPKSLMWLTLEMMKGLNFLIKAKNFQPLDLDLFFSCPTWYDMHC